MSRITATDEVLDAMGIQSELDLMGLFQGVGLPFQSESAPAQMPNMVWLYRVPILLYWAEHEETLGAIITHVLVHEIGHHFGLSDDDMYEHRTSGGLTEECDEGHRRVPLRRDHHRGRGRSGEGQHLPLHRLPDRHRLGVPRLGADPRQPFKMKGQPTNYVKTTAESGNPRVQAFCGQCGSPIYSTSPGEGQQASYMVRVGILKRARPARAEAAELVPLGAELGHAHGRYSEEREAAGVRADRLSEPLSR